MSDAEKIDSSAAGAAPIDPVQAAFAAIEDDIAAMAVAEVERLRAINAVMLAALKAAGNALNPGMPRLSADERWGVFSQVIAAVAKGAGGKP